MTNVHRRPFAAAIVLAATLIPACFGVALMPSNTTLSELEARSMLGGVYMDCKDANSVALTFDDGPAKYHADIAKTLSKAGVKGTFFVNGNNFDCIWDPHQVSSLETSFAAGHQIASHTWSHPDLATLNRDQIRQELVKINTALQKILGVIPSVMRPPFGSYNDDVRRVAGELGQSLVLWSFDSNDANGATPDASKQAYTALANRRPSTVISLEHETIETTAHDVLPFAIQTLKDKGYNFLTISECLGIPPYQSSEAPAERDVSWKC